MQLVLFDNGLDTRARLDAAIGYVDRQNKAGRMQYAEAIERNCPIGTGITEAAAKTVVGTRRVQIRPRHQLIVRVESVLQWWQHMIVQVPSACNRVG